jgi:hypothetical protein
MRMEARSQDDTGNFIAVIRAPVGGKEAIRSSEVQI